MKIISNALRLSTYIEKEINHAIFIFRKVDDWTTDVSSGMSNSHMLTIIEEQYPDKDPSVHIPLKNYLEWREKILTAIEKYEHDHRMRDEKFVRPNVALHIVED